jgi:hypothetical protein
MPRSMKMINRVLSTLAGAGLAFAALPANAQTTAFTYQGVLSLNGTAVDSPVNASFRLFNAAMGGSQVGATVSQMAVPTDGLCSASLDFAA